MSARSDNSTGSAELELELPRLRGLSDYGQGSRRILDCGSPVRADKIPKEGVFSPLVGFQDQY